MEFSPSSPKCCNNSAGIWSTPVALLFDCDFNFVATSGEISSPEFPYPPSQDSIRCQYMITALEGKHIQLQFLEILPTDSYRAAGCLSGGLKIYELWQGKWSRTAYYCFGNKGIYIPYVSRQSNVRLVYRARNRRTAFKFKLRFKVLEGLKMELSAQEGLVVSPHFLVNSFPHQFNYTYRIKAANGMKIHLFFSRFGSDITCESSPLDIKDGEFDSGKSVANVCGKQFQSYLSSTNVITMSYMASFITTTTVKKDLGFQIYYSIGMKGCDKVFNGASGRIYSPLYGSLYPEYVNCSYKIDTEKGKLIFLNPSFDMQRVAKFVQIVEKRNGSDISTGFLPYSTYYSSGNAVKVTFHSQNNSDYSGFYIDYNSTNGCNLVFRDKKFSDDFASNSFPSNYTNNMVCNYTMLVSSDEEDKKYTTYLFITSLDLEWSPSCEADSLSVYDGPDANANILEKFCGSTRRRSVIASGKEMFVQFRSNDRVTAKGFRAYFLRTSISCNKTYDFTKNKISSQGFPNQYSNRLSCTVEILGVPGSNVTLNFSHFDLEWSKDCSKDSLKIFEGPISNQKLVSKRCGNDVTPYISQSSTVILKFKSDDTIAKTGYSINYDVRNGYKIKLIFRQLDLQFSYISSDELRIYNGLNSSAPLARTIKGSLYRRRSYPFTSSSSTIYLEFRSYQQSDNKPKGFKVDFFENHEVCKKLMPCGNKGRCNDLPYGEYKCDCYGRLSAGINCTNDIGLCGSSPCQNGGVCSNLYYSKKYICNCPGNFGGTNCDYEYGKFSGGDGLAPWAIPTIIGVCSVVISLIVVGIRLYCKRRSSGLHQQNIYSQPKYQQESAM
eukprot:gene8766-14791_t